MKHRYIIKHDCLITHKNIRTKFMKNIIYILIVLLTCGCWSRSSNDNLADTLIELNVDVSFESEFNVADLFDSVEFIPIDNNVMIGDVDMLTYKDDSLFLLGDSKFTKSLFLVNGEGRIINSYKYSGNGPEEGVYLRDIAFDQNSSEFIALISDNDKLLIFDDCLQVKNYIRLLKDYFRLFIDCENFYLYGHNDQLLSKMNLNEIKEYKIKSFEKDDIFDFNPTPVFYKGINNHRYFNIPYDPYVYRISGDSVFKFFRLTYNDAQNSGNEKAIVKKYPPVVKNIIETNEMYVIFYSYEFITKAALYSKDKQSFTSIGNSVDEFGLMDKLYSLNSGNQVIYGTMTANDFLMFCEGYKNAIKSGDYPKIILHNKTENVGISSNPVLIRYYLKELICDEK